MLADNRFIHTQFSFIQYLIGEVPFAGLIQEHHLLCLSPRQTEVLHLKFPPSLQSTIGNELTLCMLADNRFMHTHFSSIQYLIGSVPFPGLIGKHLLHLSLCLDHTD
jgi:hypothetical protein